MESSIKKVYADIKVLRVNLKKKRISDGSDAKFHVFNSKPVTITMAQLHVHDTGHYHQMIRGQIVNVFVNVKSCCLCV